MLARLLARPEQIQSLRISPFRLLSFLGTLAVLGLLIHLCWIQFTLHEADGYRMRWVGAGHDRNAHYRYGLEMAADIKTGDFKQFLNDFDAGSWVWPPLNGLLVAAAALAAGPDPIFAIIPGLLGWCMTAGFAYLLAGRLQQHPASGIGLFAAASIIASPAHRAYSTDIMLETLGAGLTMASLYAYVVWANSKSWRSMMWLGISLSLLFFQKYNYWLLVVISLVFAHFLENVSVCRAMFRDLRRQVPWRNWLLGQLRRPLNYPILLCAVMTAIITITGGTTLEWQGKPLEARSSRLFVMIGYALVLLRFTIWWWSGGRHHAARRLPGVKPLFYWHMVPVLVWFVIPFRFTTFLWFISPANTERQYHATFLDGVRFYWNGAAREYVPFPELLPILAVGVVLGLIFVGRSTVVPRGKLLLPLFVVLALFLTVKHPNHKLRFLHTVMPAVYLAGWFGYHLALEWLLDQMGVVGRLLRNRWLLGVRMLLLALAFLFVVDRYACDTGHASEAGLDGQGASLRDITDALGQHLNNEWEPVAIFSNVPSKFWAKWCYLERFPHHTQLQVDCRQAGVYGTPTQEQFDAWCASTNCKTVIFVYISPKSRWYEQAPPDETTATIVDFLPMSPYTSVQTEQLEGGVALFVYRRFDEP